MTVFPDQRIAGTLNSPILTLAAAALLIVVAVVQFSTAYDLGMPGLASAGLSIVFLIIAGAAIEHAVGGGAYLLGLMMCGLLAMGLPMAFETANPAGFGFVPLAVGAMSGGLAGMFPGWRVRPLFFMPGWLGKFSIPSYLLLLLWLVADWVIVLTSSPGYEDILLALQAVAGGFVIGVVTNRISLTDPGHLGKDYIEQLVAQGLSDAEELVRDHSLTKARRVLLRLVQLAPRDITVLRAHYAAWKFDPTRTEFHHAAAQLLDRPSTDPASNTLVLDTYSDYLAVTQGQPKLPVDLDLSLARLFVRNGKMDLAANIVNVFLQDRTKHEDMAESILSIAEGYLLSDRSVKAIYYADTVIALFPGSRAALSAQAMLEGIDGTLP